MSAACRRACAVIVLTLISRGVWSEPVGFFAACVQIYGNGEIGAPVNSRAQSAEAKRARDSLKRTVDALIEANRVLVGTMDGKNDCQLQERILHRTQGLELSSLHLSDLSPLASLTEIQSLTLSNNDIQDVTPLGTLVTLRSLDLSGNAISNVEPLKRLTGLLELRAIRNSIRDISSLAAIPTLVALYLDANQISDVHALTALKNLTRLSLNNNKISDINDLWAMPNLAALSLNGNSVSSLRGIHPLAELDLSNNPIDPKVLAPISDAWGHSFFRPGLVWSTPVYQVPTTRNGIGFVNDQRTIKSCIVIPEKQPPGFEHYVPPWPACQCDVTQSIYLGCEFGQ